MPELTKIKEKLSTLKTLREEKRAIAVQEKDNNKKIEEINKELVSYFEENNLTQLRVEFGLFFIESKNRPNIENFDEVKAWLEERKEYDMMLTFNTNKFKGYYNELLSNNQPLPPGVKQYIQKTVKVRG